MTAIGRSPRRTQAERRASSEDALLRAAAELIAERGFERTSLRSIGGRAGTSREMPAYHFGSKEALITRLAERAHERTLQATAKVLEATNQQIHDLSALETLRLTIETYLEVFAASDAPEERALMVMWGATFTSDCPLPTIIDTDRQTHAALVDTIRAGQEDGSIRTDVDADAAAVLLMGMARGTAALSLAHPDAADPAKVREFCGEVMVASLRNQPAPATAARTQTTPTRRSSRSR